MKKTIMKTRTFLFSNFDYLDVMSTKVEVLSKRDIHVALKLVGDDNNSYLLANWTWDISDPEQKHELFAVIEAFRSISNQAERLARIATKAILEMEAEADGDVED